LNILLLFEEQLIKKAKKVTAIIFFIMFA